MILRWQPADEAIEQYLVGWTEPVGEGRAYKLGIGLGIAHAWALGFISRGA